MCDPDTDPEGIGVSSIFNLIHRVAVLVRMCPTLDLSCEENTRDGNGTPSFFFIFLDSGS